MSEEGTAFSKEILEILDAVTRVSRIIRQERQALHKSHVRTALALACFGERFPTRGEVATRIVRRAVVLMELDREIKRREGDYYAQREYRQVTGFWTLERREQLPVELRPILDEILKTNEEDYVKLLQGFGSIDRMLGQQIERRIIGRLLMSDESESYVRLFRDWRDARQADLPAVRQQHAVLTREVLQTVSTQLHVQDRDEIETVLKDYETSKYATSVRSHIDDVLKGAREAFALVLTRHSSLESSSGGTVRSFDDALKVMKDVPEVTLRHSLEMMLVQMRAHIEKHLPCGEFILPLIFDGPQTLVWALSGEHGGTDFDREAALRLIDELGLDLTAPAAFVVPRKVSSTSYEADGHFFFYPLADRVLILAMPDDRNKRAGYPGLQIYLIKGDLETAKEKAVHAWHPVREGDDDNFFAFRRTWQPLEPGYDPRAFWHLLGEEGLKKVAAHLELRKQFPNLSGT